MNPVSLFFWIIFVVPLVGLMIWVMRQDKRKGSVGLIVLSVIVIGAIVYMFVMTKGK